MPDVLHGKEFQLFKGLLTALRSLLFILIISEIV
nr:MAG TPA: Hsc70-interacting protein [Caudoviricetes sp.]